MTVRELLAAYMRHSVADGVHGDEARTQREQIFKLFVAAYGDMPVSECKPFHLSDFISGHTGWYSMASKKRTAIAINAAWNWAVDEEPHRTQPVPSRQIFRV